VERSRITVNTQAGPQPNSQVVRISSPAKVNEAVVTVKLKSSCGSTATRRYVLLSDVISEAAAPLSASLPLPALARSQSAVVPALASVPPAAQATSSATVKPESPVSKKSSLARQKLAPVTKVAANNVAVPVVKASNSAVLDELHRRVDEIEKAQAAGKSNAEVLLQNGARAKALEADMESLRIATAKNQKNLQAMATALEATPSQDYGRGFVYLLGALLVACAAAFAYIVLRLRNNGFDASPWWSGTDERSVTAAKITATAPVPIVPASREITIPAKLAATVADGAAGKSKVPESILSKPVDQEPDTTRSTVAMDVLPVPPSISTSAAISPRSPHVEFGHSNTGVIKAINTKEMLDVRQQAEFFMALGQHDEAVRLLESNIRDSVDANPLVFLDLLKILHTLSRRADFERYREEFNVQFTGRILDYSNFLLEGNGLDAYEEICQQIVVLWPTEYTIDFIEQCLVRTPDDDPEQGIDLEAFKDLLLLYGVLRRLEQTDESAYLPFSTSRTANAPSVVPNEPSSHAKAEGATSPPLPVIEAEPPVVDVDLDLDLHLDIDLDIDLDLNESADKPDKPDRSNNLIDFDMPDFVKPPQSKPTKP
jgi:hypothetical protein